MRVQRYISVSLSSRSQSQRTTLRRYAVASVNSGSLKHACILSRQLSVAERSSHPIREAAMAGVSEMENANHAFEHHKFQAAICRRVPHRQGSVWRLPTSDPIFCHSLGLKEFFFSAVNMSQLLVIFHLMSKKVLVTGNGCGTVS